MDINTINESLRQFFDAGFGFVLLWIALVALFFWLASKFNPFQEQWRQWEGSIITAIKLAEKQIPDDTPNTPGSAPGSRGLAKLDMALRFVLQAYADANGGKTPPAKLTEQIKQGIQIKHHELDRSGTLNSHH